MSTPGNVPRDNRLPADGRIFDQPLSRLPGKAAVCGNSACLSERDLSEPDLAEHNLAAG